MFLNGKEAIEASPEILRIGVLDWKIERWHSAAAQGMRCYGQCANVEQVIRIDVGIVSAHKVACCMLHEVGHAIYYQYGLQDEDHEERVVGAFALGWAQVYRDNPTLLTWLAHCFEK